MIFVSLNFEKFCSVVCTVIWMGWIFNPDFNSGIWINFFNNSTEKTDPLSFSVSLFKSNIKIAGLDSRVTICKGQSADVLLDLYKQDKFPATIHYKGIALSSIIVRRDKMKDLLYGNKFKKNVDLE